MVVQQKVMPVYIHSGIKYISIWQRKMFEVFLLVPSKSHRLIGVHWLEKLKLNTLLASDFFFVVKKLVMH